MCDCRRSDDEYQRLTEPARSRNERHQAAAQHQHALAMQQWQRDYDLAVMEWNAGQVIYLFACKIMHTPGASSSMPTLPMSVHSLVIGATYSKGTPRLLLYLVTSHCRA